MDYKQILLILLIFIISCTKSEKPNSKPNNTAGESQPQYNEVSNEECVDFVALWSAEDISKKIGKDKKWVFLNYTVDIWDIPPSEGSGNSIGQLRASSYARIINRTENDYLVESPITKAHGWLNKSHVKTISRKNIRTRKLCNE